MNSKEQTEQLLHRIEQVLKRMELDGVKDENCKYYLSLKSKYEAIKAGNQYIVTNVAPYLIAYVGSLIPNCNYNHKGELIPTKKNINRHEIALEVAKKFKGEKYK